MKKIEQVVAKRSAVMLHTMILMGWLSWQNIVYAQQPPVLSYPDYPVHELSLTGLKHKVFVQIVDVPFRQVVRYFMQIPKNSDWKLVFPDDKELEVWLQALNSTDRSPVIMLSLTNLKTKVNLNLTIGTVFNASLAKSKTIITIHITKSPFGH